MTRFLLVFGLISAVPAFSGSPTNTCARYLENAGDLAPRTARTLLRFAEVSQIYHPSEGEAELSRSIQAMAESQGLSTVRDSAGNLLVRIPGTQPALVLQSHLDMVDAVKDFGPGQQKKDFFGANARWEITDGVLHSEGHRTTIGADNGLGVAVMLTYFGENRADKQALELVFTVGEEIGLQGAQRIDLPITGTQMISLDGEEISGLDEGAMGAKMIQAFTELPTEHAGERVAFDLLLNGLLGGHSGGKIHLRRGNAVALAGELVSKLQQAGVDARMSEWSVGDMPEGKQPLFNMIPSQARWTLTVPPTQAADFKNTVDSAMAELRAKLSDEERDLAQLSVTRANTPTHTLTAAAQASLLSAIEQLPTSVMNEAVGYPNSVKSASNISFLSFTARPEKTAVTFGVMPRSFSNSDLENAGAQFQSIVTTLDPHARLQLWADYPAWDRTPNSSLTQAYTRAAQPDVVMTPGLAGGGLEAGLLLARCPSLREAIVVGPTLSDVHEPLERFEIRSLDTFVRILDRLIP